MSSAAAPARCVTESAPAASRRADSVLHDRCSIRLGSPAIRRYPASTRALRSPAGLGWSASFARKHAAATAIETLEEARPASCSSARYAAKGHVVELAAVEPGVEPS